MEINMGWSRYCSELESSDFDAAYEALTRFFQIPAESREPEFWEAPSTTGSLGIARDVGNGFFAARLHDNSAITEAFLLTPSSAKPRIGFSVFDAHGRIPSTLQRWLLVTDATKDVPSFTTLATLLASKGSSVVGRDHALDAAQAEIDYLRKFLAEHRDDYRRVCAELRDARCEADQVKPPASLPADKLRPVDTGDDLVEWCARNEERIVVLPRARAGVKKSLYEDPSLIITALEMLAGPYRDLRLGRIDQRAFNDLLFPSGLRLEGSVAPSVAGEQGDTYFVTWGRRRYFLGLHLLKGGGRDERFCFRAYFCWDGDSQRVIVGSMPAHLSNSLS